MPRRFDRALRRQLERVDMRPHGPHFLIPMRRFPIPAVFWGGVVSFLGGWWSALLVAFVVPAAGAAIAAAAAPEEDPDAY